MAAILPAGQAPTARDLAWAWAIATAFSGAPSTLWALVTGGDVLEATRAAGAMLIPVDASTPKLVAAAAAVHLAVSAFWAVLLFAVLPRRRFALWALLASVAIALLDLRLIAPAFFPEVAALAFLPQLADHLMWGACLGLALEWRQRRRTQPVSGGAS